MNPLLICALILAMPIIASINIFDKKEQYRNRRLKHSKSGFEIAKEILVKNGLDDIYIVEVPQGMYDSYEPSRKTIKLRTQIFHGESIFSAALAAYAAVHALAYKEKNTLMRLRTLFLPAIVFVNKIAYITLLGGIIFQDNNVLLLSVAMSGTCLTFHVLTLSLEYNAANRAKELLDKYKLVSKKEVDYCEKVLSSASFTYVATVLTSFVQIIYDLINIKR